MNKQKEDAMSVQAHPQAQPRQRGRRPKQRKQHTLLKVLVATSFFISLGALLVFMYLQPFAAGNEVSPAAQQQPSSHFMDKNQIREIRLKQAGDTSLLDPGHGVAIVNLVEGVFPVSVDKATVLTDTNCAPDANGISHCHNELQFADGSKATIQHHHEISKVGCFTPGQVLKIIQA